MPTEGKYLTVSEFASRSHRSRKRIYDLMQGKLAPFCKTIDGRKVIDEAGLSLFDAVKVTGESCQGDSGICKGDSSETVKVTKPEPAADTRFSQIDAVKVTEQDCKGDKPETVKVTEASCQGDNALAAVLETLREQLAVKDRQIEQLSSQNAELTAALRIAQEQLSASQAIQAGILQRLPERAAPETVRAQEPEPRPSQDRVKPEPVRSSAAQPKQQPPRPAPQHKAAPSGSKRRGFFARVFGKKG